MANTQVLDEERDLLFGIDNACPNWRGLRMKERAFVIDLFRLRSTPHKPTEKQMVWLRAIHARVTAPAVAEPV